MILKKPYAFLIKYFRLIHLILAIPIIYLTYKSTNIVTFFSDYVANDYSLTVNGDLSAIYINILMYLGIIIVILSAIAVYLLFKYKEKPRKNYIAIIIYYLMLFILFNICHGILEVMEVDVIEASLARSYRDISLLLSLPQYYFCIFTVLRGLGFNVKKLNFADDLKELEISEKDSEEFEFVVGVEGYKAKRTIRRFLREFMYYIKENTFIFIAIVLLAIIGIGTSIYLNKDDYEANFKQGEIFNYQNFSINATDSIITNLSYNGTVVTKDKYYLILKLNLKNNSSLPAKLEYSNFRIKIDNEFLFPIIDKASHFEDYAIPYKGEEILSQTEKDYLLVYELTEENLKDTYELKIYNSASEDKGEIKTRYTNVKLTPLLIDQLTQVKTVNIGEKLDITNSNIGKTSLTVFDYNITNKYTFNYERCYNNNCKNYTDYVAVDYFSTGHSSTLLVLNYDLLLDDTYNFSDLTKNDKNFFSNFASLRYKIADNEYTTTVANVTPKNISKTLVLQVNDKIKNADELKFQITIRNKIYSIKLK